MPNNDCAHFRFILQKLYEYATIQYNILYTIYRLDGWIMSQLKFYHIVLCTLPERNKNLNYRGGRHWLYKYSSSYHIVLVTAELQLSYSPGHSRTQAIIRSQSQQSSNYHTVPGTTELQLSYSSSNSRTPTIIQYQPQPCSNYHTVHPQPSTNYHTVHPQPSSNYHTVHPQPSSNYYTITATTKLQLSYSTSHNQAPTIIQS